MKFASMLLAVVAAQDLEELSLKSLPYYQGSSYMGLSAKSKRDQLWKEINADHSTGSYPGVSLAEFFVESMTPTFKSPGDTLPKQKLAMGLTGEHQRIKLIHCVAGHALVKLDVVSNPFTGIFQGANYGIARLSSSTDPTQFAIGPGMGLKFLRDGMDSTNTVAMFQAKGQPGEWNFFEHTITNELDPRGGDLKGKPVLYKSSFYTDWVYGTGTSDMAQFTESGKNVGKAVFPFKLDFVPPSSLTGMVSDAEPKDHMDYINQFKKI